MPVAPASGHRLLLSFVRGIYSKVGCHRTGSLTDFLDQDQFYTRPSVQAFQISADFYQVVDVAIVGFFPGRCLPWKFTGIAVGFF